MCRFILSTVIMLGLGVNFHQLVARRRTKNPVVCQIGWLKIIE
jgi:hypothetical protein